MKKKVTLFISAYIIFLISLVPSGVVVRFLLPDLKEANLSGFGGTIWNGDLKYLRYKKFFLEDLSWEIGFKKIFLGQVALDFKTNSFDESSPEISFSSSLKPGIISFASLLYNSSFSFILQNAKSFFYIPDDINLNSSVSFASTEFDYSYLDNSCLKLEGYLTLKSLLAKTPVGNLDLKDFKFLVSCFNGGYKISITEEDNSLGLSGSIIVSKELSAEIDLNLTPSKEFPKNLESFIPMIFSKNKDNSFSYKNKF